MQDKRFKDPGTGAEVDLSSCDREPIHIPGRVQSFGCLLALTSDWIIAFLSDNCTAMFGTEAEQLIDEPLRRHLGSETVHTLRSALQASMITGRIEHLFGVNIPEFHGRFNIAIHHNGEYTLIEFEAEEEAGKSADFLRAMLLQFSRTSSVGDLHDNIAISTKLYTGYDRVMVYQFLPDGSGEVIAEAKNSELEPFLGLRYPASDVPRQARELYKRSLVRVIADVHDEGHLIWPQKQNGAPELDLSLAQIRAVSPIHLEYLRNMGVAASMSVSILLEGELWGLIACHHHEPRCPGGHLRTQLELFAELYSMELSRRLYAERASLEKQATAAYNQIITTLDTRKPLARAVIEQSPSLKGMLAFDGVGCLIDGHYEVEGQVLSEVRVKELGQILNRKSGLETFESDSLSEDLLDYQPEPGQVAGVLAISISKSPRDYIFFFRCAEAMQVRWAGNPEKPVRQTAEGARLTPRESFKEWVNTHLDHCPGWSERDITQARSIRLGILELTIRHLHEKDAIRQESANRQDLLISELNHRVRNILNLVGAIVSQTHEEGRTLKQYVEILSSRISALASAHDQLTHSGWSAVSLRRLLEKELGAYLARKQGLFSLTGPDVSLVSHAVTPLVLVFHELITNAAKYGSLSSTMDGGDVQVDWQVDPLDGLVIHWREVGGPPIEAVKQDGFGMTIVRSVIPHDLHGEAHIDFQPTGLRAKFRIPKRYIVMLPEAVSELDETGDSEASVGILPSKQYEKPVLVVEDSLLIAMDIRNKLTQVGFANVEVAGDTTTALAQVARLRPAFAVLDVHLGTGTSFPLAQKLHEMGVPILFATGYGADMHLPEALSGVPVLTKPIYADQLVKALQSLGVLDSPA